MSTAAAIAIKRKRIIKAFRDAGATSFEQAKTPEELGIRNSLLLKLQINKGVLVKAGQDRLYLDEERELALAQVRRRVAFVLFFVMALVIFLAWFFAIH